MADTVEKWRCPRCQRTFDDEHDAREHTRDHAGAFDTQDPQRVEVREQEAERATLGDFATDDGGPDLSPLPEAEREIVEETLLGDTPTREFQRERGWSSPRTASSLLSRACERVPELASYREGVGR